MINFSTKSFFFSLVIQSWFLFLGTKTLIDSTIKMTFKSVLIMVIVLVNFVEYFDYPVFFMYISPLNKIEKIIIIILATGNFWVLTVLCDLQWFPLFRHQLSKVGMIFIPVLQVRKLDTIYILNLCFLILISCKREFRWVHNILFYKGMTITL